MQLPKLINGMAFQYRSCFPFKMHLNTAIARAQPTQYYHSGYSGCPLISGDFNVMTPPIVRRIWVCITGPSPSIYHIIQANQYHALYNRTVLRKDLTTCTATGTSLKMFISETQTLWRNFVASEDGRGKAFGLALWRPDNKGGKCGGVD
jgi:hypothetical protein